MPPYGPQTVTEARAWLADCQWADMTRAGIMRLPAHLVMRAVQRHYAGGVAGFIADGGY